MSLIQVQNVTGAQHLRAQVMRVLPNSSTPVPAVMDIYTGWIDCQFQKESDDATGDTLMSFVPLGTKTGTLYDIQGYPTTTVDRGLGDEEAIGSASISNFGRGAEAAWVEPATDPAGQPLPVVKATLQNFPGGMNAKVLILTVSIGVEDGDLNAVAYQVTVLSGATQGQLIGNKVPIDRAQTPN